MFCGLKSKKETTSPAIDRDGIHLRIENLGQTTIIRIHSKYGVELAFKDQGKCLEGAVGVQSVQKGGTIESLSENVGKLQKLIDFFSGALGIVKVENGLGKAFIF